MKNINNYINENSSNIKFKLIEPDLDYDDEYKLELLLNNKVIGYIIYQSYTDDLFEDEFEDIYDEIEDYSELIYIKEFHVNGEYRSGGYGKKLFDEFIKKYVDKPCLLYASNYDNNNNSLKDFYKSFNFKQINNSDYFIYSELTPP